MNTHIAGVVVHARPERLAAVRASLDNMAGLEVHATSPEGRLVVTVEGDARQAVADALTSLHRLDGVLSACLVYEHSETESSSAAEAP